MGKAFRTTIQEEMEAVKELWKDPDIQDRFLIVKQKLEDHYADILEEVYGRADGTKE